MLKLYGTRMSRAARSLWALEELGLKYEHVPLNTQGDSRKPEYLKVNPKGHVPALEDDGQVFWESMAVNLYLAEKYGEAPLWPSSVADYGHSYQWSLWAVTETEAHLFTLLANKVFLPKEQRSDKTVAAATEALKGPLKVLDGALAGKQYLLGSDFTIARAFPNRVAHQVQTQDGRSASRNAPSRTETWRAERRSEWARARSVPMHGGGFAHSRRD